MDPSGTFIEYDAKAIGNRQSQYKADLLSFVEVSLFFWFLGSGSEGAQHALEEAYHKVLLVIIFNLNWIAVHGRVVQSPIVNPGLALIELGPYLELYDPGNGSDMEIKFHSY